MTTTALIYATPSLATLTRYRAEGRYRQGEDQLEKRCCDCGEYLPADTEFFYRANTLDGLKHECKVCFLENSKKSKEAA